MRRVDGNIIATLRKQRGWDQTTLAEKAQVDVSVISRLERNLQPDFKFSVVAAVADVLEISIDSLTTVPSASDVVDIASELQIAIEMLQKQPLRFQRQMAAIILAYLNTMEDS